MTEDDGRNMLRHPYYICGAQHLDITTTFQQKAFVDVVDNQDDIVVNRDDGLQRLLRRAGRAQRRH